MKCNGVFCARVRDWFSGVREHVTKFVEYHAVRDNVVDNSCVTCFCIVYIGGYYEIQCFDTGYL